MAEPGAFPTTHTTSVKTTTTTTSPVIRLDKGYIKTLPGILKASQILCAFVGFICVAAAGYWHSRANWYSFVSMFSFWTNICLYLGYLFHVIEKFSLIPWLVLEFGYNTVFAFFYFVAALVMCTCGYCYGVAEAWAAAAFFAFVNMLLFGAEAFFKYKGWRAGDLAQGERIKATSQTGSPEVPPPSYPGY